MNKSFRLPLLAAILGLGLMFGACKRDDTDGVSIVRNYPSITLTGQPILSINVGDSYTDAGAVTKLNGAVINTIVRGSVNTAQPGINYITYIGRNPEGDSVTADRIVVVVDPAVNSLDLSGTYERAATGGVAEVTKVGNGLYLTSNVGGIAPTDPDIIIPAYFAQLTPTTIKAPTQLLGSGAGRTEFSDEQLNMSGGNVTGFQWRLNAEGVFGTALRVFVKQ